MKYKISLFSNIIFLIVILLLGGNSFFRSKQVKIMQDRNKQLAGGYEKQLEGYAKASREKSVISDAQFEQELRSRALFVFKDYKGRGFKHLNTTYKFVLNKKNNMVHKSHYPGGSAAYAIGLENREYSDNVNNYPEPEYTHCSYCFPKPVKSLKSSKTAK